MSRVIGLTGLIGTGKSEIARLLERCGALVHDADKCVHELYGVELVQREILRAFPLARNHYWRLDRTKLVKMLRSNSSGKTKLEAILHPKVRASQVAFLHKNRHKETLVLDVPLLFETHADQYCDEVWVTHCRPELQRARVLARPGFTPEKFETILKWQGSDTAKRAAADRVINTGASRARLLRQIQNWLK